MGKNTNIILGITKLIGISFIFVACSITSSKITIDSYPSNAKVVEKNENKIIGRTPYIYNVSNSVIGTKKSDCKYYKANLVLKWDTGETKNLDTIYVCYEEDKHISFNK